MQTTNLFAHRLNSEDVTAVRYIISAALQCTLRTDGVGSGNWWHGRPMGSQRKRRPPSSGKYPQLFPQLRCLSRFV